MEEYMKYQAKIIGAGHALPSRIVTSDWSKGEKVCRRS